MLRKQPQNNIKCSILKRKNTILFGKIRSHNPEVVGSSPASATKENTHPYGWVFSLVMDADSKRAALPQAR